MEPTRCAWVGVDALYRAYHDEEWGLPVREERRLFEMLSLEGAQAGLSWRTILGKRHGYRRAFADFDPEQVARFGAAEVTRLLADPGIVRNRLKITATIDNARALLALRDAGESFSELLWGQVGGHPLVNHWQRPEQVPAITAISDAMSKALKRRGFRFIGPTICYAFMQAVGMVNDHTSDCYRHAQLASAGAPADSDQR